MEENEKNKTSIVPEIVPTSTEVIKNRVFGMPTTKMTRHQKVSFTSMIKIAYDMLSEDKEKTTFEYPTKDFFQMIGITQERKQSHLFTKTFIDEENWEQESDEYSLERTLKSLVSKSIDLRHKGEGGKTYQVESVALLSYFSLTKEKIIFRFDEWVRERIYITDNAYIMKLPIIATFKSVHTVTLFEQLEQRRSFRRWEVSVGVMKKIFGLEEGEYTLFADFRRYVLNIAKEEINQKTKYSLKSEFIKKGRKIDKIVFTWHINKTSLMEFQEFIRANFINIPLVEIKSQEDDTLHCIKVSEKGKLYNSNNKTLFNYPTARAKVLWKWMYDNQDRLLIKDPDDKKETSPFKEKYFTKYYGKDFILDGEMYKNIILITPVKTKLKIKFYQGELLLISEEDFLTGVLI